MHMLRKIVVLICLVTGIYPAKAQAPSPSGAGRIIALVDSFNRRLPAEKLFLHFDKSYYAIGDTIWFKAYLFQAATYGWSPLSGLLYVELINDSSRQIKRMSIPVNYGVSWGQIPLGGDDLPEGSYTVRAYTRWMENFGDEYFFTRHFMVVPATVERLSARRLYREGRQSGGGQTGGQQSGGAQAEGKADRRKGESDARRGKIDLQFMPEGGWLVTGIPSRIGFKAIGENGWGVDVQGTIVDKENKVITSFRSLHRGMGVFDLLPESGNSYSAVVVLPDGSSARYPLPAMKTSGVVLRIDNKPGDDSIRFSILPSADLINSQVFHLVALSRGVACYGSNFKLNKKEITGIVAKSAFPSGIAHFTLFNGSEEPVNERSTFIDHADNLYIECKTDKPGYRTRDSIPLHLKVMDVAGKGIAGSFSMAVTDDAQVPIDSLLMETLVTRLLLTADLKGFVETPGWYFSSSGLQFSSSGPKYEALDALLLTQGWTGYNWQQIAKQTPVLFAPEPSMMVTGRVTDLMNRPVKGSDVVLVATGKSHFSMDTVTGPDGRFVFSSFPPVDTVSFIVQARTAKGKSLGLGVTIDENKLPAAPTRGRRLADTWYENAGSEKTWNEDTDSALFQYVRNNETMLRERGPYGGGAKVLQPVVVKAQFGIKGSHNLNGPGQADQVVDEAMIEKAGKLTLKQLLLQTVKGFRMVYSPDGAERYKVLQYDTRIIIDGVNLSRFGPERETLDFLNAEDIAGIEVMYNARHNANYKNTFLSARQQMDINREYAFIEITTRSGNGIFMKRTPGLTTVKPLPVSWPREFYRPRYPVRDERPSTPDLRSTIHWEPNILTNHQGQAETFFYSAGVPTTYTIIIQGSDMDGNIGVRVCTIKITE